MRYNIKYIVAVLAVVLIAFSYSAYAAPAGASTNQFSEETYTSAAGTSTTEGGNVTGLNISGDQQTVKWAGFFGNISGGIVLKDSSGDSFYEWTVSDVTNCTVYAANESVTTWSNLANAAPSNMYSWLVTAGSEDAYNETFKTEATANFNGGAITANSTTTWTSGSQGVLRTYSLIEGGGVTTLIWANKANASYTGFDGSLVDYQVLVPAPESPSTLTYSFYLEIP